jgi:ferredoxin
MKVLRKIIHIDEGLCDGCGLCVPSCAEGAIQVVNGKARVVADKYCDGLGACIGECPKGALTIEEREADEFDEEAVEAHLSSKEQGESLEESDMACGCPSGQVKTFHQPSACGEANAPVSQNAGVSALSHWPVQIRLVPPSAPFLKNADLLVAADCTAVAYPNFHNDFLTGKAVMVGCPKFDDVQGYIRKFADIFKTDDIKRITVVVMEVPCCQGLPAIIGEAMKMADKNIPMEKVTISSRGEVLNREKLAA